MKIFESDIVINPAFRVGAFVRIKGRRPVGKIVYMPGSYNKKSVEFRSPNENFYLVMDVPVDLLEIADKKDRFIYELELNRNDYAEIKELRAYVNKKKKEMRENDLQYL